MKAGGYCEAGIAKHTNRAHRVIVWDVDQHTATARAQLADGHGCASLPRRVRAARQLLAVAASPSV